MSLKLQPRPRRVSRFFVITLLLLAISAGGYVLVLSFTPQVYLYRHLMRSPESYEAAAPAVTRTDQVIIPRLGITIGYQTGGAEVLDNGLWHRYPDRGNPETGGNFILAGHRFRLAPTPLQSYRRSPLIGINHLNPDDRLLVDFNGKRYTYSVTKRYRVKPTETTIESATKEPRLTLYSCTLGGEFDGREVIEATPAD